MSTPENTQEVNVSWRIQPNTYPNRTGMIQALIIVPDQSGRYISSDSLISLISSNIAQPRDPKPHPFCPCCCHALNTLPKSKS